MVVAGCSINNTGKAFGDTDQALAGKDSTPTNLTLTQCSDGIDNDNDGKIDCVLGNSDPGCYPYDNPLNSSCNPTDDREAPLPTLNPPDGSSGCHDSDDGVISDTAGSTVSASVTLTDYCADENTLIEYSCENDVVQSTNIPCTDGCAAGACIASSQEDSGSAPSGGSGSSRGGGSGSSGSGSSSSTAYDIGEISAPVPVTADIKDTISFVYQGIPGVVTITATTEKDITLTIDRISATATLVLGQTKSYDLDKDGRKDITLSLTKLSNGKATILFDLVPQPTTQVIELEKEAAAKAAANPPAQEPESCNNNQICESGEQESCNDCIRQSPPQGSWIPFVISLLALIGVTGYTAARLRSHKTLQSVTRQSLAQMMNSNYSLQQVQQSLLNQNVPPHEIEKSLLYAQNFKTLDTYVRSYLAKGYPEANLKQLLVQHNWPADLVDDVIQNMHTLR